MSFLKKVSTVASPTVDLADFHPDVVESKLVEEDQGTEGSWEEEARAPYKVFKITKIKLSYLNEYPELEEELKALKPGDTLKYDFSYKEDDGSKVDVEGSAAVKVIRWLDDHTLLVEPIKMFGLWEGETPPQSHAGRARVTLGDPF